MKRQSRDDAKTFRLASTIILSVLVFFILLPILLVVIASVTDENVLISSGYTFFPSKLSLDSYYYMVKQSAMILRAYGVTITVTCVGTIISVLITTMLAYPMSRPNFRYRNVLAFFVFFTMLFNGGLVPTYMVYTNLINVKDTLAGMIVPYLLMNAFFVIIMRTYFTTNIPGEVLEAARIDGAGEVQSLLKIVLPMSKPILATIALMTLISYWNNWTNGIYFLTTRTDFYGIQNYLNDVMNKAAFLQTHMNGMINAKSVPNISVRMAIAVVAVLPLLIAYPFFQKYFVKGITLGSVKG